MEVHIYQDASGGWRWRAIAKNGKIMGDSGESYANKANAKRAAMRFRRLTYAADIVYK